MPDTRRPRAIVATAADERISVASALFQTRHRQYVTLIGKLTARLAQHTVAPLSPPEPILFTPVYADPSPASAVLAASETAPRLLTAEVTLVGSAHHPAGQPQTSRVVSLGLYREAQPLLHKQLFVYGDRSSPHERPAPFQSLPIDWSRAFGGPGNDANPTGRALDGSTPMPNVVDPRNPRHPAGFGPVSPHWPIRTRLLGGSSPLSLEGADMTLPDDFPFAFFQAAPLDQRVPFLQGDEWLMFDGLHPRHERFQTRLPGVRVQASLTQGDGPTIAVPLLLDSVAIDMERGSFTLLFRGNAALEVEPRQALAAFTLVDLASLGRRAGQVKKVYVTTPLDLASQLRAAKQPATPYVTTAPKEGVAEAPGAPWIDEPAPAVPEAKEAKSQTLEIAVAPVEVIVVEEAPAPPPSMRKPPLAAPVFAMVTTLRDLVTARLAKGEALDGLDLTAADLSGMDLSNAKLASAKLDRAMLARTRLDGANLSRASLFQADLRGASLRGTDLSHAALGRATLDDADLHQANLTAANLQMATAVGARFTQVRAERVNLSQTRCGQACFDKAVLIEADFSSASLEGASFMAAQLDGARLSDATADDVILRGASLKDAHAQNASFRRCDAEKAEADRSNWELSDLSGARLVGVVMRQASLAKTLLDDIDAQGAIFDDASLARASLDRARLTQASFCRADLRQAKMEGASAAGAQFEECSAQKLNAKSADLRTANLRRATLRAGRLDHADLREARLDQCDLRDVSFQGTKVVEGGLEAARTNGANLKGVVTTPASSPPPARD